MRPLRLVLTLAVVVLLAPAALAGNGPPPVFPATEPFFFVDKTSFDKITSLANFDLPFNEYCLAGRAAYVDQQATPNRRVEFLFDSLGTIAEQSATKVEGTFEFVTVDLTLTVWFFPTLVLGAGPLFTETITSICELEGEVSKAGERHKVRLDCNVGPELSAFTIPATMPAPICGAATPTPYPCGPDVTRDEVITSVDLALAKKKTIKLDLDQGSLLVKHSGEPMPPPPGFTTTLTCPTSGDIIP
jgi:hypothetical protein